MKFELRASEIEVMLSKFLSEFRSAQEFNNSKKSFRLLHQTAGISGSLSFMV